MRPALERTIVEVRQITGAIYVVRVAPSLVERVSRVPGLRRAKPDLRSREGAVMSSEPSAAAWDPNERRRELIAGCQARLEAPGVRVEELLEISRLLWEMRHKREAAEFCSRALARFPGDARLRETAQRFSADRAWAGRERAHEASAPASDIVTVARRAACSGCGALAHLERARNCHYQPPFGLHGPEFRASGYLS